MSSPFGKIFKPRPASSLIDAVEKYRKFPIGTTSRPGSWQWDNAPAAKEVMRAYDNTKKIVVMGSSQVLKTELINNIVLFSILDGKGDVLVVEPTESMAASLCVDRLKPMLVASLSEVPDFTESGIDNATMYKITANNTNIFVVSARSAASLASRPVKIVLLDEVDRYPAELSGEGHPINIAEARTSTFPDPRVVIVSTPTVKGESPVENEYNNGSKGTFCVTCNSCGESSKLHAEQALEDGVMCSECGVIWSVDEWKMLLKTGHYTHENPESQVKSFHFSRLASPWANPIELHNSRVKAKKDNKLRTWFNLEAGLPADRLTSMTDFSEVMSECCFDYEAFKPPVVVSSVTAGIDVQGDRVECEVLGFTEENHQVSLGYMVESKHKSEDITDALRRMLDKVLALDIENNDGSTKQVEMVFCDTGYKTQKVYALIGEYDPHRVRGVKGSARQTGGVGEPKSATYFVGGGKIENLAFFHTVSVFQYKKDLYDKINEKKALLFPRYGINYFKQLMSEAPHATPRGVIFKKVYERNEALDCRIYALAAKDII